MAVDRRDFLIGLGITMAASGMQPAPAESAAPSTAQSINSKPPNVILMICDDLGYGDLGCYGIPPRATT